MKTLLQIIFVEIFKYEYSSQCLQANQDCKFSWPKVAKNGKTLISLPFWVLCVSHKRLNWSSILNILQVPKTFKAFRFSHGIYNNEYKL